MNVFLRVLPRNFFALLAFSLMSCGEDLTTQNVSQSDLAMGEVSDAALLPICGTENEGAIVLVTSDMLTRVCVDGIWKIAVAGAAVRYSCSAENLPDGGAKIVCNGDSVGVVHNGTEGDDGLDGADCEVYQTADSLQIIVTCGTVKTAIYLGYTSSSKKESSSSEVSSSSENYSLSESCSSSEENISSEQSSSSEEMSSSSLSSSSEPEPESSSEPDDTKPVSLDSLSGFSQKGPFVRGSIANLYELESGRTLRQTNGNFVGTIKSDDGLFVFNVRNLVSQYVLLQVTGYYRNEVSGKKTSTKLSLMAMTDVSERNTANVNLLTHLEYDRMYYLVTHDKVRFKDAKKRVRNEILSAFYIDTVGIKNSEDLTVFGETKGDAALLAISILLQGDRDIAHLTELLTEISKDMELDGKWDNEETRKAVAEWVMLAEADGRYAEFRKNVKSWGLSDTVPEFETMLHHFWTQELIGKDLCDEHDEDSIFDAMETYGLNKSVRYMGCKGGLVKAADYWEGLIGAFCSDENEGQTAVYHASGANYDWEMLCSGGSWNKVQRILAEGARVGTITDSRDGEVYRTAYVGKYNWMAEHLRYRYLEPTAELDSSSVCYGDYDCERIGRNYTWSAAIDSTAMAKDPSNPRTCGCDAPCEFDGFVKGICPEGWHLPTVTEIQSLLDVDNVPYSLYSLEEHNIDYYQFGKMSDNVTDDYGFSFLMNSYESHMWSSELQKDNFAYTFTMYLDTAYVGTGWTVHTKKLFIRCVEDYEE